MFVSQLWWDLTQDQGIFISPFGTLSYFATRSFSNLNTSKI